jgi:hypothetical protein
MTCHCGFDNTPLPGGEPSKRCGGCGVPLRPDSDDPLHSDMPAPGFNIAEGDDSHIVTESDVENYPELDGVLVIHRLQTEWGRGIGAEPYGHFTRKLIQVEEADEPCEKCGSEEELVVFSQDHAAVMAGEKVTCARCEHEKSHYVD